MTWPKYVLLIGFALWSLSVIARVGKPAKPFTGESAAAFVLGLGVMAWLVVIA